MKIMSAEALHWPDIVRPGDMVLWSQALGEPLALSQSLMAERHAIGGRFGVFLGTCYSKTLAPEQADVVDFHGMVGTAGIRPLSRNGLIDIHPVQYAKTDRYIESGQIPCDVALIQVSGPDAQGRFSYGATGDYIRTAVAKARVVVAEINAQAPFTCSDPLISADDIDFAIETDRPMLTLPRAKIGDVERAIARNIVDLVPDRAVIQPGVGPMPDAILDGLRGHRDLGVHAGTLSDGIMELMKCGAVTNAVKEVDPGLTITGNFLGSGELLRFAHQNRAFKLMPPRYTHDPAVLAKLSRFISLNAALEVDITGQVNSEAIGNDYVGTVGGQVDYVRAAVASPGGRSFIALASTTPDGKSSRIVARLNGPVTTPRSDVDVIVTEWGRAELQAKSLSERTKAMIAIAHPDHREPLSRAAHEMRRKAG